MRIPNRDVIEVEVKEGYKGDACFYCKKVDTHLGRYGPLYKLGDLTAHYFCLLFSKDLNAHGKDDEGIFGYKYDDIKTDLAQGQGKVCKHCFKNGATIQCCKDVDEVKLVDAGEGKGKKRKVQKVTTKVRCSTTFHYSCARDQGVRFQFRGTFKSFCDSHTALQRRIDVGSTWKCSICVEPAGAGIDHLIRTRCCECENFQNVFHMSCLQLTAMKSGADTFKCPQCWDKTGVVFIEQMRYCGIYIPVCGPEHLFNEQEEADAISEKLPQPVVSCRVVKDEDWGFYSMNMRNGIYDSNKIVLSLRTPWPKELSKGYPELKWKRLTDGGSCSPASSNSSKYCYSGFLRFKSGQEKQRREAKADFELVLVVFKGTVLLEYNTRRRSGQGRHFTQNLGPQSVASIQPGISYALKNTQDQTVVIFYMLKKMDGRKVEVHPRLTEADQLAWSLSPEPGSPVGVEYCWTWETHHQGFVKIPPLTCTGFGINKQGHKVYFVYSGEIVLRSSKFKGDRDVSASSSSSEEDEDNGHSCKNEVPVRCLVSDVYKKGSSFVIPLNCCYVIENWDDSINPEQAVLFYDIMETRI